MKELLLKNIYKYYPQNAAYGTKEYYNSPENKNREMKLAEKNEIRRNIILFEDILNRVYPSFNVIDWTNYEETSCIEFKVLLKDNQDTMDDDIELIKAIGGKRLDLCVYVSCLAPFFYYSIVETFYEENSNKWIFYNVEKIDGKYHAQ